MSRTTLDTAALAHDLRLAVMRFSRRLRNQRVDHSVTLTHARRCPRSSGTAR